LYVTVEYYFPRRNAFPISRLVIIFLEELRQLFLISQLNIIFLEESCQVFPIFVCHGWILFFWKKHISFIMVDYYFFWENLVKFSYITVDYYFLEELRQVFPISRLIIIFCKNYVKYFLCHGWILFFLMKNYVNYFRCHSWLLFFWENHVKYFLYQGWLLFSGRITSRFSFVTLIVIFLEELRQLFPMSHGWILFFLKESHQVFPISGWLLFSWKN
jgi:hypothetical protein